MKKQKDRTVYFKAISILLPFFLLFLLELILRLSNYGHDPLLFREDPDRLGFLRNNPYVSSRFFVNDQDAPTSYSQVFKKFKDKNTVRIFVLGESSGLGFPYNHRGSFPRMLEYWLSRTFPDVTIEMINLSITAVNSYTLLSFANEIIGHQPDAILIYTGHNEYYGAMGVGSRHRIGSARSVIRTVLYLKKFRVVQLAFNVAAGIKHLFVSETEQKESGLMYKVAGEQEIRIGSKLYYKGIQQFEKNMDAMLRKFHKHNIPVYFSDLVSNLKDQAPFINTLQKETDTLAFMSFFRKGLSNIAQGDTQRAIQNLLQARIIDSTYARCSFLLGDLKYGLGQYDSACMFYRSAKECDALRFRAPEEINNTIYKLTAKYDNITFVPSLEKFKCKSPHRILDNSLFTDHLHPNLRGYFLIAGSFYEKLHEKGFIGKWDKPVEESDILKEMPVTAVDSVHGNLTVMFMKEEWPFFDTTRYNKEKKKSYAEMLGIRMFFKQINWEMAMDSLFIHYKNAGNYEDAIKVAKAVDLEHPYEPRLSGNIAGLYFESGRYNESLYYFERSFRLKPSVETGRKIVLNLLQLDKLEESIVYLEYLRKHDPADRMSVNLLSKVNEVIGMKKSLARDPGNVTFLKKLAGFYLSVGNFSQAKYLAETALALQPKDKAVQFILDEIKKQETATKNSI